MARRLKKIIEENKIDIVHIHNIWPLISPSIFFMLNKINMPYLQTIHNYRYIVVNAYLYKDDVIQPNNMLSIKKRPFNAYKNSAILTFLYWLTARFVRWSKVIDNGCGGILVFSKFKFEIFSQIFSPKKIFIKGHYIPFEITNNLTKQKKDSYYLFLGRLSEEKGVETLIKAFLKLNTDIILKIAGIGSQYDFLKNNYKNNKIEFLGLKTGKEKYDLLSKAKALIVPSEWLETFGLIVLEAYFSSTPVVVAKIGSLSNLILEEKTGLLFESGDVNDLTCKLNWCENNPEELEKMGGYARKFAEENFSEEKNYKQLMEIYEKLLNQTK